MTKKLKEMRQAANLSQSQLAEKAGLSLRTLQHYEQGAKEFDHARIDTILKVCLVLNCKLEDIIENQEYLEMLRKLPN
jgi:transcriptional regulator with XRE-family HTH domain